MSIRICLEKIQIKLSLVLKLLTKSYQLCTTCVECRIFELKKDRKQFSE